MKSGIVSGSGGSFSSMLFVSFSMLRDDSPRFFIFSVVE